GLLRQRHGHPRHVGRCGVRCIGACPVRFVRDTPAWRMAKPDRLVWHAPRLGRCLPRKRGVSAEDNAARTVRVRAHGIDSYLDLIQDTSMFTAAVLAIAASRLRLPNRVKSTAGYWSASEVKLTEPRAGEFLCQMGSDGAQNGGAPAYGRRRALRAGSGR